MINRLKLKFNTKVCHKIFSEKVNSANQDGLLYYNFKNIKKNSKGKMRRLSLDSNLNFIMTLQYPFTGIYFAILSRRVCVRSCSGADFNYILKVWKRNLIVCCCYMHMLRMLTCNMYVSL